MSEAPRHDGREIVLVVGGGIAAYKSAIVAREILRRGGSVETVLTRTAQRFVGGVTFAGITGRAARTKLWDPTFAGELHIELTRRAHAIVVAPATANLIARAAHGIANDLATTVLLSAAQPVVMAPAMHPRMWEHPATRANVEALRARGVTLVGPVIGPLASGESGIGRMSEPDAIVDALATVLRGDLAGVRVLVTAGPTYEAIDPVRFVGNRSSGKMGFALADRAARRGASVTLVHGPVSVAVPAGVNAIGVRSAREMRDAVVPRSSDHDVVIMAAAVADYRPETVAKEKLKKTSEVLDLHLVRNPDILAELGSSRGSARHPVLVGFAVESRDLLESARDKLTRKRCDLVVANLAEHGFEGDDNVVTLVSAEATTELGRRPKHDVADAVLDAVKALLLAPAKRH